MAYSDKTYKFSVHPESWVAQNAENYKGVFLVETEEEELEDEGETIEVHVKKGKNNEYSEMMVEYEQFGFGG